MALNNTLHTCCMYSSYSGKSSLLMVAVKRLVQIHGQHTVFVTATTGLAACAIGGITVQQFAGICVSGNLLTDDSDKLNIEEVVNCVSNFNSILY